MEVIWTRKKPLYERLHSQGSQDLKIFTMFEEGVRLYEPFRNTYVSTVLGKTQVGRWKAGGYLIDAQTGSGKSTFFLDIIIPIAMERRKKCLLVVPRVALEMQYKKNIAERYAPHLLKELTNEGIKQRHQFGPVDVYTMQQLSNGSMKSQVWDSRNCYDFVILDEVHAFVGDAAFNPYTQSVLNFLVTKIGAQAIRIYISATPDIVIENLAVVEQRIGAGRNRDVDYSLDGRKAYVNFFRFEKDYSYIQPVFFSDEASLIKMLNNIEDKTLIFVKTKKQGQRLLESLGEKRATFIDAQSKANEEKESFGKILDEHTFDKNFLIVTKFLDVGVDLKDIKIKNVIIFQHFKEEVIQMVGRKRIKDNETVKVFFHIPTSCQVNQELNGLRELYDEMKRNINLFQGLVCFSELPYPLYVRREGDKLEVRYNHLAFTLLEHHIRCLEQYMWAYDNEQEFQENFCKCILEWFPRHKPERFMECQKGETADELEQLMAPLSGKELDREELGKLCDEILKIANIKRRKDQESNVAMNKVKEIFRVHSVGYRIQNLSKQGRKGVWLVERGYEWV